MTPLTIYLWQQADSIRDIFLPISILGLIGGSIITAFYFLYQYLEGEELPKGLRNGGILILMAGLICHVLYALLPSSKTIAMMVAIPAIANSEPIQKDIPELYQLAKEALKEQITGGKK